MKRNEKTPQLSSFLFFVFCLTPPFVRDRSFPRSRGAAPFFPLPRRPPSLYAYTDATVLHVLFVIRVCFRPTHAHAHTRRTAPPNASVASVAVYSSSISRTPARDGRGRPAPRPTPPPQPASPFPPSTRTRRRVISSRRSKTWRRRLTRADGVPEIFASLGATAPPSSRRRRRGRWRSPPSSTPGCRWATREAARGRQCSRPKSRAWGRFARFTTRTREETKRQEGGLGGGGEASVCDAGCQEWGPRRRAESLQRRLSFRFRFHSFGARLCTLGHPPRFVMKGFFNRAPHHGSSHHHHVDFILHFIVQRWWRGITTDG